MVRAFIRGKKCPENVALLNRAILALVTLRSYEQQAYSPIIGTKGRETMPSMLFPTLAVDHSASKPFSKFSTCLGLLDID